MNFTSWDELTLAYAVRCIKAGERVSPIVFALVREHYMLLQRNLLYTAITRAKRLSSSSVNSAPGSSRQNDRVALRNTGVG